MLEEKAGPQLEKYNANSCGDEYFRRNCYVPGYIIALRCARDNKSPDDCGRRDRLRNSFLEPSANEARYKQYGLVKLGRELGIE